MDIDSDINIRIPAISFDVRYASSKKMDIDSDINIRIPAISFDVRYASSKKN
jgi:hypothetical protein